MPTLPPVMSEISNLRHLRQLDLNLLNTQWLEKTQYSMVEKVFKFGPWFEKLERFSFEIPHSLDMLKHAGPHLSHLKLNIDFNVEMGDFVKLVKQVKPSLGASITSLALKSPAAFLHWRLQNISTIFGNLRFLKLDSSKLTVSIVHLTKLKNNFDLP